MLPEMLPDMLQKMENGLNVKAMLQAMPEMLPDMLQKMQNGLM